jgi:hypothetical protein
MMPNMLPAIKCMSIKAEDEWYLLARGLRVLSTIHQTCDSHLRLQHGYARMLLGAERGIRQRVRLHSRPGDPGRARRADGIAGLHSPTAHPANVQRHVRSQHQLIHEIDQKGLEKTAVDCHKSGECKHGRLEPVSFAPTTPCRESQSSV